MVVLYCSVFRNLPANHYFYWFSPHCLFNYLFLMDEMLQVLNLNQFERQNACCFRLLPLCSISYFYLIFLLAVCRDLKFSSASEEKRLKPSNDRRLKTAIIESKFAREALDA